MRTGKRTQAKRAAACLLAALAVGIYLFLRPYQPDARTAAALKSDQYVMVKHSPGWISFEPRFPSRPTLILYPGGLVLPESYAPLARRLAAGGHRTYVVKMPFNLPVLGQEKASEIMRLAPTDSFVIGGHALGGSVAARYAAAHPDKVQGLFLLAAYADNRTDLSRNRLPVLVVTGSRDGVLRTQQGAAMAHNLPSNRTYVTIAGGNHAQFGSYGPQTGDQPATITPDAQTAAAAKAILQWLKQM